MKERKQEEDTGLGKTSGRDLTDPAQTGDKAEQRETSEGYG